MNNIISKNWFEWVEDFTVLLSNGICRWYLEITPYMIAEWLNEPNAIFYSKCPKCGYICVFSMSLDEKEKRFKVTF